MHAEVVGYVLLAAAANVMGGLVIYMKKSWSKRGTNALMALGAGLLLSIAVLDLIPEVTKHYTYSAVFILIGMMVIFLTQQLVAPHVHFGEDSHPIPQGTLTGSVVGMLIHTFFDGFSIVASFELDFRLGITVFIALLLHKIPDGITISSIVFSLTASKKKAIQSAILMGVSTLAGAAFAGLFTQFHFPHESMIVIALSISAGIFLYVVGTDLLPSIQVTRDRILPVFVILGILIYFLLQWGLSYITAGMH